MTVHICIDSCVCMHRNIWIYVCVYICSICLNIHTTDKSENNKTVTNGSVGTR